MEIKIKQLIKLSVYPKLLRLWADQMEESWATVQCGDSTVFRDIYVDESVDLHICYDQDNMDKV